MPVARLRGVVEDKGDDWLIVGIGGLGLLVQAPASCIDMLEAGAQASLHTYLHVREDALTLYGFATADDLRLFEQLIGVSGVGPRAALGLLSALDYARLTGAIASGHADVLRRVPGIGQKTAERIVLDLRDKVSPPAGDASRLEAPSPRQVDAEVVAALMGLGYTQAESADAASRLQTNGEAPLEERVRQALALFARPRG
jgi:Holliday junction DNA helicase RuvA